MSTQLIEALSKYTLESLRAKRSDIKQLRQTFGGFLVIIRMGPNGPEVLLKKRPDDSYDLPGGGLGADASDPNTAKSAIERTRKELQKPYRIIATIGEPLYWIFPKQGEDVLDMAQAYLADWQGEPSITDEALELAWVHDAESFCSVKKMVGHDPDKESLGRMPLMVCAGLSAARKPFLSVPLTEANRRLIIGEPRSDKFSLFDGGNYLARPYWETTKSGIAPYLALYHQFDPYGYKHRRTGLLDMPRFTS